MSLYQTIQNNLKDALKNKDLEKVSVLRMLISSIRNEEIAQKKKPGALGGEEIITIVSRHIKQRKDSIAQFEKGGRNDLADKEKSELQILQTYLPEQSDENEIRQVAQKNIKDLGNNFGAVMGKTMSELKGKADGNLVRQIVEKELRDK